MSGRSVKRISGGSIAVVSITAISWLIAGCGGEEYEPDMLCLPGEQKTCVCSDGEIGYQKCYSSGRMRPAGNKQIGLWWPRRAASAARRRRILVVRN